MRPVLAGDCANATVAPSVRSTLTAILGREAAYRKDELTLAALVKEGMKVRTEPNRTAGLIANYEKSV